MASNGKNTANGKGVAVPAAPVTTQNGPTSRLNWQVAGTDTKYCKIGAYGPQGSGKTTTMTIIAGLIARLTGKKAVYMVDSENGADYVSGVLTRQGIELKAIKTREFGTLVEVFEDFADRGEIVLVDSATHFSDNVRESYMKARGRNRLELRDYGPCNDTWRLFTRLFVNSKIHALLCGRMAFDYENYINEDGKTEFYKSDSRMKAADQIGHEPALLVKLEQVDNATLQQQFREANSKEARAKAIQDMRLHSSIDFVATIEKDRTWLIQGQRFVFTSTQDRDKDIKAVEDAFMPFVQWHLKGTSHSGVQENGATQALMSPAGNEFAWQEEQRRRDIAIEELEGQIVAFFPGTTGKDKAVKAALLETLFGTRSWTKIEKEIPLAKLEQVVFHDAGHPEHPSVVEQKCQDAKAKMEPVTLEASK